MGQVTCISSKGLEAKIDSQGAQLMSLRLNGAEYLWQGDERWWPRRAPILFPIVGVLRDDAAVSAAGEVRLKRHGLARTLEHTIVDAQPDLVRYELTSTDETLLSYPYRFKLNMTYSVDGSKLKQTFTVTNIGDEYMPFTLGGHPAFNVPVPGDEDTSFGDYELRFTRPWTAESPAIGEDGLHDFGHPFSVLKDSDVLPLSHKLFEKRLTITLTDVPGRTVTLIGKGGDHGVEVDFDDFDYLGIWSAPNKAPFVAIEPWLGLATATDESDIFEEKRGMHSLEPGGVAEYSFSVAPF